MSLENMSTCNGREVPRMITVHNKGVMWSPKNELAYIVGGGDGYTHIEHTKRPTDEFDEFDAVTAGKEPFLNILHRRRLTKKAEEDIEYKWKQTVTPDVESVKEHVLDLVSKLKKQFSHEKQVRKQHTVNAADNAKYVWNNSVDAFLRHHEKPKIDIRFSESDDDQSGEGLFTFSVRPSRIRKRETREDAHACTVPQNIKEETSHVKVSGNQNETVVREEIIDNIVAMHDEEVLGTSIPLSIGGTINGDVISSCYRAPMLLDTFYNHAVTMLNKANTLKSINGHVVHQNFETSQLCGNNENSFLTINTVHRQTDFHGNMVPPIYTASRYEEICQPFTPETYEFPVSKEGKDFSVPLNDKMAPLVDICGHAVPPVCVVIIQEEVYMNAVPLFSTHSAPSCYGQPTFAIYGHSVPPAYSTFTHLAHCHSVPSNCCKILKHKDLYGSAIPSFNNAAVNEDFLDHTSEPPVTELFEERMVQTDKVVTPDEVPCTPPLNRDPITTEDRCLTGPPPNHHTITDIIVDEFDDDSPFGIMSVYCRSELHSQCCTVLEAER